MKLPVAVESCEGFECLEAVADHALADVPGMPAWAIVRTNVWSAAFFTCTAAAMTRWRSLAAQVLAPAVVHELDRSLHSFIPSYNW